MDRKLGRLAICCVVAAFVTPTAAAGPLKSGPMTVGGIALGEPIALPKCRLSVVGDAGCWSDEYSTWPESAPSPPQDGRVEIRAKFNSLPSGFAASLGERGIVATITDGKVSKVEMKTDGVEGQADALRALTQKYGKPSVLTSNRSQNMMGAKFSTVTASWKFTNISVLFVGAYRVDEGVVTVQTSAQSASDARQIKEMQDAKL